ncbi:hypothetical protein BX666DRAFT_1941420 [Dichotomocladium elegans]|nr:hypothetical protein BX666DRAFT_1941420 [Dichotomocladium elegans]
MSTSDPIAPYSAPIVAYMSVHSATNLAYAKYYGRLYTAQSASFESLTARGFWLSYLLASGARGKIFIEFKPPLTNRDQIRPALETMAREAEAALGLVKKK